MTLPTLANRFLAMSAEGDLPGWRETALLIERAGRFALSPEVVKLTLKAPRPDKLLPAVAHGIQLPHDPCWIEYSPAEVFNGSPGAANNFGLLFWREPNGEVCNRLIVRKPRRDMVRPGDVVSEPDSMAIMKYPCDLVFRASGAVVRDTQSGLQEADMVSLRRDAEVLGWLGLTFVLLLTAKNAPLSVGESDDIGRLNRQRMKSGKAPLLTARPVRWNLSREQHRAIRASLPFDRQAQSAAMAHMVRGHVKVRKSGVFWWAPHFRNTEDDELATGRDYVVC